MPRKSRRDVPGSWHHIMNRGIARRTIFDHGRDMQFFLDQLGEAAGRGDAEVHAFCLMRTHYHLLVRSPCGKLAHAMQRIQTEYSRWFNRSRKRDGPLVRARYCSKRIDSVSYRRAVVAYIDRNPVHAGMVSAPENYRFGSARAYLSRTKRQVPWLDRSWIEEEVRAASGINEYTPRGYRKRFGSAPRSLDPVIESRWASGDSVDPLDDLIAGTPEDIRRWMRSKALLADGTTPGLALISPRTLTASLDSLRAGVPGRATPDESSMEWRLLRAGLGRDLCAERLAETGKALGVSLPTAGRLARLHRERLELDPQYAQLAGQAAHRSLGDWRWS